MSEYVFARTAARQMKAEEVMPKNTHESGRDGEQQAAEELERRGITIIARNFRSRFGEIDLIGLDGETLVFIEVKAWRTLSISELEYGINQRKRERIRLTACEFIQKERKYSDMTMRFDVVFIGADEFRHIVSAWTCSD
jgi:putative endonuclease